MVGFLEVAMSGEKKGKAIFFTTHIMRIPHRTHHLAKLQKDAFQLACKVTWVSSKVEGYWFSDEYETQTSI